MAVRAGYKQTEIGVIPEDWEVIPLASVVDFLDNQRRPVKDSDRAKMQGAVPYYGASGIVDFVNDYLFDEELILLGEDGENILSRNSPLAFRISGKAWVNNHAHVLRTKPGFAIGYVSEYLESLNYEQYNSGTAQPKLKKETCQRIPFVTPPTLAEQTAIAEALGDADAHIRALEQLIAKKRLVKAGAMQQLLTGQRRLPGFGGDWEVRRLGEIAKCYSGGTPSTEVPDFYAGEIPWITSGDLNQNYIYEVRGRISQSGLENSAAKMIEPNTLLVALYGATAGVTAISRIRAAINQAVLAVIPDSDDSVFLYFTLSYLKNRLIHTYTQGGQPNLSGEIISSVEVVVPSLPEQTAIAAVLSDMDGELAALEAKAAKARLLKEGMMQELLTGRIRLV